MRNNRTNITEQRVVLCVDVSFKNKFTLSRVGISYIDTVDRIGFQSRFSKRIDCSKEKYGLCYEIPENDSLEITNNENSMSDDT